MRRRVRTREIALGVAGAVLWMALCGFGPLERARAWLETYAGNKHMRAAARAEKQGEADLRAQEAEQAARAYAQALEAAPGNARAGFNLGLADAMQGDLEQAYADFARAAEQARGSGDRKAEFQARYNAGTAGLEKGDYEGALHHLQRAAQLAPDDPRVLNNLRFVPAEPPPEPQGGGQQQPDQDEQQEPGEEDEQQQPAAEDEPQQAPPEPTPGDDDQPLTPEQAEQLLSALARDDADIQKIIRRPPVTPPRATDKDW